MTSSPKEKKKISKNIDINGVCKGGITRDFPRTFTREEYDDYDDRTHYKFTLHLSDESGEAMNDLLEECQEICPEDKILKPFIYDFKGYNNLFTHRFSIDGSPNVELWEAQGVFDRNHPNQGIFSLINLQRGKYGEKGYVKPSKVEISMTLECSFEEGNYSPYFSLEDARERH
jgi:hypothetical protein